ncbi:MAG: hypothetical protein SOU51_01195 [Collinsella sp.]|nr:hypothetical protein [Collinsella sp.]
MNPMNRWNLAMARAAVAPHAAMDRAKRAALSAARGQGSTEYIILVIMIIVVVIAIVTIFRTQLGELGKSLNEVFQQITTTITTEVTP